MNISIEAAKLNLQFAKTKILKEKKSMKISSTTVMVQRCIEPPSVSQREKDRRGWLPITQSWLV